MLGWIGLAPPSGDLGMIPPQVYGGNLDNRLHAIGAELALPVQRPGALLMVGDPHAAQGDGEVCGTGIETPARARLQVDLLRGRSIDTPRLVAPAPPAPSGRWLVTEGVGPDPRSGARVATEQMITVLEERGLEAIEAYLLLSVAGHLRLSEVVDEPNWVVSMLFSEELAQRAANAPPPPRR
jgi:acetamidase/formamidase